MRSRLVLLVLSCLLPAAAVATIVLLAAYQECRATLIEHAHATTRAVTKTLDSELVNYGLTSGFLPEHMAAVLGGYQLQPGWVGAILDDTGTIVARTHQAERFVGRKGTPVLLAAMAKSDEGMVETQTLDGVPVLAVFHRSELTRWAVAIGVPKQALLAPLQRWLAWLVAASLVLFALGIAAARRLASPISQSIRALIEPAVALGQGHAVDLPPLGLEEAKAVGDALKQAARLLHRRTLERDEAALGRESLRRQTERLEHAALHDPLTGLANRTRFLTTLADGIQSSNERGGHFSVLFIDLDDFKPVNDTHGHAVGDDLLRLVATRLRNAVRDSDVVARLGGDEFAVLLVGLGAKDVLPIARMLVQRLSEPYAVRRLSVNVSACIGTASYPTCGRTAETLLEAADAAMYRAKAAGKRQCAAFRLACA